MHGFRSIIFLTLVIGLLGVSGCDLNRIDPEGVDLGLDYFPVEVGAFRSYQVERIDFLPLSVDTQAFFLKEQIAEMVSDGEEPYYVLHRFVKDQWDDPWELDSAWKLISTTSQLIVQRSNRQELDLVFPLDLGDNWDVNAFNTSDEDNITLEEALASFDVPVSDSSFSDVLFLSFPQVDNAINEDNRVRYYARGVGLIYQYERVTEQQPEQDLFGYQYEASLVDYGTE